MRLTAGTRLGPYEVVAKLGEGGMGEVWRARDTKLERDVAIKVLPEAFVADEARLTRFEREAKLLAQLNHPNIAHIFGLETGGGTLALVMELVEGPTLAERLKSGALPVEESLSIAREVAEALEEAHEKGIIHRDLKPANIKASPEGRIKVLDFGLAKAMEPDTTAPMSSSQFAHSPTLTLGATVQGVLLGTAAYMSPEQAKGLTVDKRADIWAFGVVLWEMLTGRSLFAGDSVPDTLARVLQREVDFEALPRSTRPSIRRLLRRCLDRQPRNRLHDIGDARLVIEDALAARSDHDGVDPSRGARRWPLLLSWVVALLAVAFAVTSAWLRPSPSPRRRAQFEISLPPGRQLDAFYRRAVALSPDGRTIAVITSDTEKPPETTNLDRRRIELRGVDESEFHPVAGTEGALELAFSPDGRWIAFTVILGRPVESGEPYAELRKVPIEGGRATTLGRVRSGWGLSWSPDGWIAFGGLGGPIQRVPADGGATAALAPGRSAAPLEREIQPLALWPSGNWLYSTESNGAYRILGWRPGDSASVEVLNDGADPRFVPPDHLLFARDDRIETVRFDSGSVEARGAARVVASGVARASDLFNTVVETGQAQYDVATDGTIVYAPGGTAPPLSNEWVWIDSGGREEPLGLAPDPYLSVRLSADGSLALLSMIRRGRQVEIYDGKRGIRKRLVSRGTSTWAIWGPGPRQATFASDHEGIRRFYVADIDAPVDTATPLFDSPMLRVDEGPSTWSPDGRRLLYTVLTESSTFDVWLYELGQAPKPYLATRFQEIYPEFSPDGDWVAYVSNESGSPEVWVRPFSGEVAATQVSVGGGSEPAWSRDGRSIYYRWFRRDPESQLAVTTVFRVGLGRSGSALKPSKPTELFEASVEGSDPIRSYDIGPDGRFLFARKHLLDHAEAMKRDEILFPKKLVVLLGHLETETK